DDFDREFYLRIYPDIAQSGIDPLEHYLRHGCKEGRLGRAPQPVESPIRHAFVAGRPTVLVVSHEASRTGAPILAWNLCRELKDRSNVIALLLGGGDITEYFNETCNVVVGPIDLKMRNALLLDPIIQGICDGYRIDFALVNSIESDAVLPSLAERYVPTVLLIHEFFAYTRPRERYIAALRTASAVVFSARIVQSNALIPRTRRAIQASHVAAQGKCEIPSPPLTGEDAIANLEQIKALLYPEGPRCFLVLGVGTVQYRKGVDLFVATAEEVRRLAPAVDIVLLWIGHGYDPENDLAYSAYVEEQIAATGTDNVAIIGAVDNLEPFYGRADMLFLSSRLDPMPNVAIDFMALGKPVICFENATGIAEVLVNHPDTVECILPSASIGYAARLNLRLHSSPAFADAESEGVRELAARYFDMRNYAGRLLDIGWAARTQCLQQHSDAATLRDAPDFRTDFVSSPLPFPRTREQAIVDFLRSTASGIDPRR
ncbi:MAG: glycosyltransferase, partial [Gammaproteobacteria bacterium]